jgi:hypothetical protein
VPDGAEGAFDAGAPASVPLSYVKLNARDDAEGGGSSVRDLRPASPIRIC